MAVRKAALIKATVTMVAPPPQKKTAAEPGVVCSYVAYALWLLCLTGYCLEDLEAAASSGQPY